MIDEFEELAEETSQRASAIRCSPAQYREGLRAIILKLRLDLSSSLEGDELEDEEE